MSDKKDKPADGAAANDANAGKDGGGKGGSKMMLITVVLLVLEAAVFGVVFMFLGKPKSVEATEPIVHKDPEEEKIVEILVLNDKLANDRSGLTFVYPTEIYVQVKKKDETWVTEEIERFKNEIRADVVAVWRTADPHHFQEARLESLTRRIEALLRDRFDKHNTDGEPVVVKCVIVSGTGIRVNR
jgi:flagellar basal body-associated protein FliL